MLISKYRSKRQSAVAYNTKSCAAQRLNTENLVLAYLVGLVEGDGWFTFSKNGKYIIFEMGIELHVRDLSLLQEIQKLLQGIGNISIYKGNKVRFNVRNKNDLREKILPIFDRYPMISNKNLQYFKFKYFLLVNCIYYEHLDAHCKSTEFKQAFDKFIKQQNRRVEQIKNQKFPDYFNSWLVGFVQSEGCFSVYKAPFRHRKNYFIASFEISQSQTLGEFVVLAIGLFLNVKTNIYKNLDVKKTLYPNYRLKVTSVLCIKKIVEFFEASPVPLLGYKNKQYKQWYEELGKIPRYASIVNIHIPSAKKKKATLFKGMLDYDIVRTYGRP